MNRFLIYIALVALFASCQVKLNMPTLVEAGNRYGYINARGKQISPIRYRYADHFSEWRAVVRKDDYFGYINSKGVIALSYKYDFAYPFSEGIARVNYQGHFYYIDKRGDELHDKSLVAIDRMNNGRAIVSSKSGKLGCIDKEGVLKVDTIYDHIRPLGDGYFEVENKTSDKQSITIIDADGREILPFSNYGSFFYLGNELFIYGIEVYPLERYQVDDLKFGVVNSKGEIVYQKKIRDGYWINIDNNYELINDGLIKIDHLSMELGESVRIMNLKYDYSIFIDAKGKEVFNTKGYQDATHFTHGSAFVQNEEQKWAIINLKGEYITGFEFEDVSKSYVDDKRIASYDGKYGMVNKDGDYIIQPYYDELVFENYNDYSFLFFKGGDKGLWGVLNGKGDTVLSPEIKGFPNVRYENGLMDITAYEEDATFINKKGKLIWETPTDIDEIKEPFLNITTQERSSFQDFDWDAEEFSKDSLIEIAHSPVETEEGLRYPVLVKNIFDHPITLHRPMGSYKLIIEAKDRDGIWKEINNPQTKSGHYSRYGRVELEKGEMFTTEFSKYEGAYSTEVRIKLSYSFDQNGDKVYGEAVSNSIPMSINPAQFWNRSNTNIHHVEGSPFNLIKSLRL